MNSMKNNFVYLLLSVLLVLVFNFTATAQNGAKNEILTDSALTRIVPNSFYFAGQSAPTQMRNAAAAKLGENRYVIAGLVDTSGYSSEISGKYEGFFITDSPVNIGGKTLALGAYGFGFSKDGKVNIFDLSGKEILSAATKNDAEVRRPRPLMMTADTNGVRLYKGKSYVLISAK
jgi:hypothetical protein